MIDFKKLLLGSLFTVLSCVAQTPAELMQKAIYAQETAGDLDGALQTYRQITATAPPQSAVAAEAQFRIAELLLQKGDLKGAAAEFNILAARYSEQQAIIARMAGHLRGVQSDGSGVVRNGIYTNSRTGVTFPVPSSWKTTYNGASSDNGEMVGFSDGSPVDYGVWTRPEATTQAEIFDKLREAVPDKVRMNANRQGYAFRPESIQNRTIAGHQAVSAIADYVESGNKMASYYTWIYTAKTHVMFVARDVPVADLAAARSHLETVIASAIIP